MLRTSGALFLNWAAQLIYHALTGQSAPWLFFFAIDTVTAIAILWRPAGKMQGIIGVTLLAQIALHVSYAIFTILNGYVWRVEVAYWERLQAIAALQLLLMGGWYGGGAVGRAYRRLVRHRGPAARRHDLASMG